MPEAEPARKRRTSASSCEGQGGRETHRTDDSKKYTAVDQECKEDRLAPQRVSENLALEQRVRNKIRGGENNDQITRNAKQKWRARPLRRSNSARIEEAKHNN